MLVMMVGRVGSEVRGCVPCSVVVWCSPAEIMSTSSWATGSWYSSSIGSIVRDVEGTGVLSVVAIPVVVVCLLSGCHRSVGAQYPRPNV